MINLRVVSIAIAVALGMLGAVQLASPESLGISAVAARWLAIVSVGLGLLQTFLPKAQGPSTDPDVIADRVLALNPAERAALIDELEHRALEERVSPSRPLGPPPPPPPMSDDEIVRRHERLG